MDGTAGRGYRISGDLETARGAWSGLVGRGEEACEAIVPGDAEDDEKGSTMGAVELKLRRDWTVGRKQRAGCGAGDRVDRVRSSSAERKSVLLMIAGGDGGWV